MKRIIVMGASVEQLPAILTAKRMGYYVGVIDYNPYAVGIPYADEYFNVSTIDIEGVTQIAKKFHTDGFITLATDLPMIAVSHATSELGLVGIDVETAIRCTNKYEMIKTFREYNVACPWYYMIESESDLEKQRVEITYPCIMKPIDNAASRGVIVVENEEQLTDAYKYSVEYSRSKRVIIEEYMVGPEVSVEVLAYQNKLHVLAVTDKLTTGAPHFVELGHNQPSMLPDEVINKIKKLALDATRAVGIKNGPAHVEIIVTKEGPKMVELGARLGGDCIASHLVKLSTGIDMLQETIKLLCGEKPDLLPKYSLGSAIRFYTSDCKGALNKISGLNKAKTMPEIIEVMPIMHSGDEITGYVKSSDDRIAYVIGQSLSPQSAIEVCENALAMISISEKEER